MSRITSSRVRLFPASLLAGLLAACTTPQHSNGLAAHLSAQQRSGNTTAPASPPPAIVSLAFPSPSSRPTPAPAFSIAVDGVPVRDLLLALARDAAYGIDLHPDVDGDLTLHTAQEPLPRLLERIARLAGLRIDLDDRHISVAPDTPTLRLYPLDYVNVSRQMAASVATTTQIAGPVATGTAGPAPLAGGEAASGLRIENRTRHHFWEAIERNVRELLRESDRVLPDGSSETRIEQDTQQQGVQPGTLRLPQTSRRAATRSQTLTGAGAYASQSTGNTVIRRATYQEAGDVVLNSETGLLAVRATRRQHARIGEFLDRALGAARRQVMIEATIVEVELGEGYRHGIDWSRLRSDGSGFSVTRPGAGALADSSAGAFGLVFKQMGTPLNLVAAVDLLQSFGSTRVLSSPRLSVTNNQPAVLKVVENIVYFTVKADTTSSTTTGTTTAVTTTPQSVSVGLILSVTPQIADNGSVLLNIRPSISSVSDWKQDPNPSNKVANLVPQIRTREIESVMRVSDGDIAVLGGLMEDGAGYHTSRVPLLGQLPVAGELLTRRDNSLRKSELVIFLRPTVIRDASLDGDYASQRHLLPDATFFRPPPHAGFWPDIPHNERTKP